MTRTCIKCKREGDLIEFPISKRSKDGFNNKCKNCCNLINKEYRDNNKVKFSKSRKAHYQKNLEKMRKEKVHYCATHRNEKSEYDKNYRSVNKDKIKKYKKLWETNNKNDSIFKIKRNLRRRVHHVLKDNLKSNNTFALIGCSPQEFKSYIESLWETGMSWKNYGPNGWHIDHIKECYKFDLSDCEQQKECFNFKNQRPLWAKDNLSRRRS